MARWERFATWRIRHDSRRPWSINPQDDPEFVALSQDPPIAGPPSSGVLPAIPTWRLDRERNFAVRVPSHFVRWAPREIRHFGF
jgi:hypothetical protein